jgi:pyruvate dehydrogenase E2 component (dihydrolipoamide acetyltransferase)
MKKEIKIPDIAENVESGVISGILVSEGDTIEEEQPVVEVETDKATTDIPSPFAGKVAQIKVKEGDEVGVGEVIMIIETDEGDDKEEEKEEKSQLKGKKKEKTKEDEEEPEEEIDKKEKEDQADEQEDEKVEEKEEIETSDKKEPAEKREKEVPASPSVRRLAREIGVDIYQVEGTGPGNRITTEDVKAFAKSKISKDGGSVPTTGKIELPDFSKWGEVERQSLSRIRQITGENTTNSWQSIPHVTQFDEADVTVLEEFRSKYAKPVEKAGGKLTVTAILLKISNMALKQFPRFNASLDMQNKEIVLKKYFNIGIAVDTEQGLLVPVIRDVDKKTLTELSVELTDIAKRARDKKINPDELQGGNFTISNLGGIGGTGFTPVIFPPQAAILGVSRAKMQPIWKDGNWEPRKILPLSLSYDHRLIDGADGARFLRWLCESLENPLSALL